MSLINRHRVATGETPEETLARLDAASRAAAGPATEQPRRPRFKVVRLAETYAMSEVDAFIDTIDQRTVGEVREVHFSTVRLRGYDKRQVDHFLDEHEARLNGAAGVMPPADPTADERAEPPAVMGSELQPGRLARIPQGRWRLICVAFWVGLTLWLVIVSVTVGALWPKDSAGAALFGVFTAAGLAALVFWAVGVARTEQIDPSQWTTTQRVCKWINDHSTSG